MAQFVRDSMTGTGWADLDDPAEHNAELGGPWVRNPATPYTRWYLFDNRCHCGESGAIYASGTPANANYYVECDYIIYSDIVGAGLTARQSTSDLTMYLTRYESGAYLLAKFVAGVVTGISGIPGGIFAPSLAVGAGLGSALGLLFGSSAGIAALLGMAGYFAGVVQAPMTAFVIILEMTGNHDNVIALMCASMLGYGTARMISHEPLYHALSRVYIADAIRRKRAETAATAPAQPEAA